MYKVQPTPVGATVDDIVKWMKIHDWEGRPVKALSEEAWLIGSKAPFHNEFLTWNGRSVLAKPIQAKNQQKTSPILAGDIPKNRASEANNNAQVNRDPWLQVDPWSKYVASSTLQNNMPAVKSQPHHANSARQVDAPTEAKFPNCKMRSRNFVNMLKKETKKPWCLRKKLNQNSKVFDPRSLLSFNVHMSQTFQSSLERALQKQDNQMNTSFAEIKQIIRQGQQPNPQKKAKAQHPQPTEDDAGTQDAL